MIILPSTQSLVAKSSFRVITEDELINRLDNRDEFNILIWDDKPRLSIAGVQEKINVVIDEKEQIGFGEGTLCSTHILKFEKQKLSHLVLNEYFTMKLAQRCGLDVAKIIDWALFNLLVSNFDAHGKNISFYVDNNGIVLAPFYDLLNIQMYSHFEHTLAMAIGDEFDSNNIHAYQLSDFSNTCGLSRTLVSRRLKLLINKLLTALQDETIITGKNEFEIQYLNHYRAMAKARCDHLLRQADEIMSVTL